VRLLAPVPRPGKIICVGLNYRDHAKETGQAIPTEPVLFSKFANSVVGPGADVVVPPEAEKVDYEAELAVVIGRRASRVAAADALGHVAGYACANDVSRGRSSSSPASGCSARRSTPSCPSAPTWSRPTRYPTPRPSASAAWSTTSCSRTPAPGRWCSGWPS
jgi:acylpyruvate hydrolase